MGRNSEVPSRDTLLSLQGAVGLGALCPSQLLRGEAAAGVSSHHCLHGAKSLKEDEPKDSWLPLQGPEGGPFLDTWRDHCHFPAHDLIMYTLCSVSSNLFHTVSSKSLTPHSILLASPVSSSTLHLSFNLLA